MRSAASCNSELQVAVLQVFGAAWRVVVQRSRADWHMVAAASLVTLLAATLLAAGVIYAEAVSLSGLHRVLEEAPATEANIQIVARAAPSEAADVNSTVTSRLESAFGRAGGEIARSGRSESFALPGQADDVTELAVLGFHEGIERHASLVDGAWPQASDGPVQAAISQPTASLLQLTVGDELKLASRVDDATVVPVRIAGIYAIDDPDDPYWWGDPLEIDGVSEVSFTTFGPFVVTRDELLSRATVSRADLTWRAFPAFDRLDVDGVAQLRSAVAGLDNRLPDATVSTGLDGLLADAERSLLVSRSGVLVLTIQLAVLAGYALILVAGLLNEQRRIETALLRSRGASAGHVSAMALMEGILLVLPAAIIGPWLAVGVLALFNLAGPLAEIGLTIEPRIGAAAFAVTGIAAVGCLAALVLPAFLSVRALAAVRGSRSRQQPGTVVQRAGLDLALVVVAGIGLWQLNQYGAPITRSVRGTFGLDPLLVAAPAIGLLAGAVLALRIVPLLAHLLEALLARRPGLVASLGARQLARRPLRYARSALLLMLAASLAIFAASYSGTWIGSQVDQADYQVAADVRLAVATRSELPAWASGAAYRGVAGVEAAMPVARDSFDASRSAGTGQLLALDAGVAAKVVSFRPDLAEASLTDLMGRLETAPVDELGVEVPGEPRRLAITVDAALDGPLVDIPSHWRGLSLTVVATDASGLVHRFEAGRLTIGGGVQRVEIPLGASLPDGAEATPDYPLRIVAVEMAVLLPPDTGAAGRLEVLGVEADAGEASWQPVPLAAAEDGWRYQHGDGLLGRAPVLTPAGKIAARIDIDAATPLQGPAGVPFIWTLQPEALAAVAGQPLPAIVNDRFIELTATSVGDRIPVGSLAQRREIEIVGTVHAFPTLDPEQPLVIVDLAALGLGEYAARGQTPFIDEWWLGVDDADLAAATVTLGEEPYAAEAVTSRLERARALLTDPVALGIIGALSLGAIAAGMFAAIGFVVSAAVAARERLTEFALLRALGLSPRQLSGWLSLENAFLLVVGLFAGIGLGLLISWVVLPFVTLTQDASAVVPPVQVVMPWEVVGLLGALAAGSLVLTVVVLADMLRRVGLGGALRLGEE